MELSFKQKLIIGIVGTLVILGVGIYIYTTNGGKEEYNFNDFYTNVEADEPKESTIIVHITGKVKNAGIIELPEESRISDAIKKAGGVTQEADLEQNENSNEELNALDEVAKAAQDVADSANGSAGFIAGDSPTLDYILDVTLQISVEVGRARMSIQDLLQLGQGAVVELEKIAGEPLDIYMNGKQVAKGEAVIVNERFGVRITDVISREERVLGLK